MKNKILLVLMLISFLSYSQKLTFEQLSQTSTKNELSKYFKKKVSKRLLKDIRYGQNSNYITLSFYINNEKKAYKTSLNTFGNPKLKKAIIKAFEKYPLEKLNIDSLSKKKEYYFQIITKKGKSNIFKTSNKIIGKTLPILNSCNDLEYYEDIRNCFQREIRKHFFNNIDFSIADKLDDEIININLNLMIDNKGVLTLKKVKAPFEFRENLNAVTSSFTKFNKPGYNDSVKNDYAYNFSLQFKKGGKPTYHEGNLYFDAVFKPNSINSFAKYLSKKLKPEDLNKANLNRINNRLMLYFELDKTDTPFNISTNSRSSSLEKKIISLFKKYPIKKFNFVEKNAFNTYHSPILLFKNDKIIVNTNSLMGYSKVPIFPGCKNSKSVSKAKACFSKGVQTHFTEKFDTNLPNELGLSKGRKRVFIGFRINKKGEIENIFVRAPHPAIKNEVKKVMLTLPKVRPGLRGGKPVNIKYSIPFTLIVE